MTLENFNRLVSPRAASCSPIRLHFLIYLDLNSENINYRLKINKNMEAYLLCPKANMGLIYSGPFMNSTDETLKARQ